MKLVHDWWLPDEDTYFERVLARGEGFDQDRLNLALAYVPAVRHGLAIDVGAHVGFFAKTLAERFDYVVALEAVSEHQACLSRNLGELTRSELTLGDTRGTRPCVSVHLCAAWSHRGTGRWCEDDDRLGNTGARFVREVVDRTEYRDGDVLLLPLDDLNLTNVDFLKIDVEGAELEVLLGAERLLAVERPVVMMEVKKGFGTRYNRADGCALAHLTSLGYVEVARAGSDRVLVPAEEITDGRTDQSRLQGPPAADQGQRRG